MTDQYRQGDVLLERTDEISQQAQPVERTKKGLVIVEGEATGHAHAVLDEGVEMYESTANDVEKWLKVQGGATVVHPDHGSITLDNGIYHTIRQQEYTPQEVRVVAD